MNEVRRGRWDCGIVVDEDRCTGGRLGTVTIGVDVVDVIEPLQALLREVG